MGFTRKWKRTDKPITPEFLSEIRSLVKECEDKGIRLRDGEGFNEPEIALDWVGFNGNEEKGLAQETFIISNKPGTFEGCKTAKKPYDYAVMRALEIAERYGLVTDIYADGPRKNYLTDDAYCALLNGRVPYRLSPDEIRELVEFVGSETNKAVYTCPTCGYVYVLNPSSEFFSDKCENCGSDLHCEHGK